MEKKNISSNEIKEPNYIFLPPSLFNPKKLRFWQRKWLQQRRVTTESVRCGKA